MIFRFFFVAFLFCSACNKFVISLLLVYKAMAGHGRGRGARAGKAGTVATPNQSGQLPAQNQGMASSAEADVPAQSETQSKSTAHNCGMCGHQVGDDSIGCDKCSNWVHPTEMCSGLPKEAISTIASLSGDAVLFVCTSCRAKPAKVTTRQGGATSHSSEELIQQLFLSVKGICAAVMDLTARMDRAFSGQTSAAPPPPVQTQPTTQPINPAPASDSVEYRAMIRQEMRELQEREKRKQSVVIKGMHASSSEELTRKFRELSFSFTGTRVELTDVVPIHNHTDLFRAKILDEDNRKRVLENAKSLKDTEHNSVFIRRDLTYAQRKELRERRALRVSEDGRNPAAEGQAGPSTPPN